MVGREPEINLFNQILRTPRSEFVVLYGRRRIGKTYFVRQFFKNKFDFYFSGMATASKKQQLFQFNMALNQQTSLNELANHWMEAFHLVIKHLESIKENRKKVIFIDELPWLDTPKSEFLPALEYFWNTWASGRTDIILITCGSAASWMINKLINAKGGLHNRVTRRIKMAPFTLKECEKLLQSRDIVLGRYQIIQLYMVLGGVPFYWEEVEKGKSATQLIEKIAFSEHGLLRNEFKVVFKSLFDDANTHEKIIKTLAKKNQGITREELTNATHLSNAGSLTRMLDELETSGFIKKYIPFGRKNRESLFQLMDLYSLFYMQFIDGSPTESQNQWINQADSPKTRAWSGYAFEQVCLLHQDQMKQALGIAGVETQNSAWRAKGEQKTQIDLLIDRKDNCINLCEMKFSLSSFRIDKKYDEELRRKVSIFKEETKTPKTVLLTLVTTFGLEKNQYAGHVQNELTMDDLFKF